MGNSLTGRVWVLDTPSTSENVISTPVRIPSMQWHPNAADNDLIVQDGFGNAIWTVRAKTGAPDNESDGIVTWSNPEPQTPFHGLRLHTMDGGKLYVTIS